MNDERVQQLLKFQRGAGPGVPHEVAAAQSEVNFLVCKELAERLTQLSEDVFKARQTLGERLSELTAALADAAKASSRQTDALVYWTKWYVFTTIAILVVAALSVVVSVFKRG